MNDGFGGGLAVSPRFRETPSQLVAPQQIQYMSHMRAIRERRQGRPSPLSGFERALAVRQINLFHAGDSADCIPEPAAFERAQHACVGRWLGLCQVVRCLSLNAYRALVDLRLQGFDAERERNSGYCVAANDASISAQALWVDRALAARLLHAYFDNTKAQRDGEAAELARAKQECSWHVLIAAHNTAALTYEAYRCTLPALPPSETDGVDDTPALVDGASNASPFYGFPISGFDLLAA